MSRSSKKKLLLKILQYPQKNTCVGVFFLNRNVSLQSWNFMKERLQHSFFPVNIAKFLKTPILEIICKQLFERFPTCASNITRNLGIEEDIFSKTKKSIQNLAVWKKLTFSWCSWSFRFSLHLHCMPQAAFSLHNKRW